MTSAVERREQLKEVWQEARTCTKCPLSETRQTVVFGAGNADADLMFVGEAPGANEDRGGLPFIGQAGRTARPPAGGGRARARRRLHRQRAQVPAAEQPRSASDRDRDLPRLPPPPGRADRAAGDLHARQLLDQAAARRPDRDLEGPRAAGGPRARPPRRHDPADLPPGRRALHAQHARHAAGRLRPAAGAAGGAAAAAAGAGGVRAGAGVRASTRSRRGRARRRSRTPPRSRRQRPPRPKPRRRRSSTRTSSASSERRAQPPVRPEL